MSIDSNEDDRSNQYSNIRRKGSSPAPSPPSSPDIDLGGPRLGIHKPDRSYGGGNNALLSLTALAEAQHQEDIDNIGGDYYGEDVVRRGGGHNTKTSQHQQHVRNSAERGNMSSGASKQQQQQQQQQLSASTMLLQKTVDLLSAHKSAIAHMVEVRMFTCVGVLAWDVHRTSNHTSSEEVDDSCIKPHDEYFKLCD